MLSRVEHEIFFITLEPCFQNIFNLTDVSVKGLSSLQVNIKSSLKIKQLFSNSTVL